MYSYTRIDIRSAVVLVKIWIKSIELFINEELLNELSPQNIVFFRHRSELPHPFTQLKYANMSMNNWFGLFQCKINLV